MAWLRLDDQIPRHEKFLRAGPIAAWVWVCALSHATSQLTDGFISDRALEVIGSAVFCDVDALLIGIQAVARKRKSASVKHKNRQRVGVVTVTLRDQVDIESIAARLVAVTLFDKVAGGYRIHDYLDHNLPRTIVKAMKAADAERKRLNRQENHEKAHPKKHSTSHQTRPAGHSHSHPSGRK